MDPVEHFLTKIIENPDKWVRITRMKRNRPKNEIVEFRKNTLKQIKTALDLMGIQYEINENNHYTIKMVTHPSPKVQPVNPATVFMAADYAKKKQRILSQMLKTRSCTYRVISGGISDTKPTITIIDEVF